MPLRAEVAPFVSPIRLDQKLEDFFLLNLEVNSSAFFSTLSAVLLNWESSASIIQRTVPP